MENDDYDLLPHSELRKIEREIQTLKTSPEAPPNSFRQSMDDLSTSLKSMIQIFSEAKNELRLEDEEKELFTKKIGPMTDKLDRLLDQNEKIAEAILSVADMIKKLDAKIDHVENLIDDVSPQVAAPAKPQYSSQAFTQLPRQPPQYQQPQYQQPRPQPQAYPRPQTPAFGPVGGMMPQQQQAMPQMQSQSSRPLDQDLLNESGQDQGFSSQSFNPQGFGESSSTTTEELFKPEGISMPPPPPPPAAKKGFFGK